MSILRLSTLSLTIVLFTLGGLISPENTTLAHHCKGAHKTPECDDGGGGGAKTTFTVKLVLTDPGVMCDGVTTNSVRSAAFSLVDFPCPVTVTDPMFDPGPMCVAGLELKKSKGKTDVLLFFRLPCDALGPGSETWVSPRLSADDVIDNGGEDFTVIVPAMNVALTKVHEPFKGTILEDTIDVGMVAYKAN